MIRILLFVLLTPLLTFAQSEEKKDVWQPFKYFVGSWKGHETGKAGIGKGERTYEFIMKGKYLHCKNKSVFDPQEKNPKGEVHEDWTFLSYDKIRGKFVLREFHIETFVNQYLLDSLSTDNKTMIFITESIENLPPGFRARLSFFIKNENEFSEKFEIAAPEKEFKLYIENFWTREKLNSKTQIPNSK